MLHNKKISDPEQQRRIIRNVSHSTTPLGRNSEKRRNNEKEFLVLHPFSGEHLGAGRLSPASHSKIIDRDIVKSFSDSVRSR